jgi:hypothetical protein
MTKTISKVTAGVVALFVALALAVIAVPSAHAAATASVSGTTINVSLSGDDEATQVATAISGALSSAGTNAAAITSFVLNVTGNPDRVLDQLADTNSVFKRGGSANGFTSVTTVDINAAGLTVNAKKLSAAIGNIAPAGIQNIDFEFETLDVTGYDPLTVTLGDIIYQNGVPANPAAIKANNIVFAAGTSLADAAKALGDVFVANGTKIFAGDVLLGIVSEGKIAATAAGFGVEGWAVLSVVLLLSVVVTAGAAARKRA